MKSFVIQQQKQNREVKFLRELPNQIELNMIRKTRPNLTLHRTIFINKPISQLA